MGKGSKRRPTEVDEVEFDDNWEVVFKRNEKNDKVMKRKRKPKNDE